jgi:recombination protein RecT
MSNELTKAEPMQTLAAFIQSRKSQLAAVLPKHMTPDRVMKIAIAACSRNPRLLECEPMTVYSALHTSSQLGLEPGGPLGAAYLVPFRNNKTGKMECQFIPGYRGLIDLARRSGQISTIFAYAVRTGDVLDFELGLDPKLRHVPAGNMDSEISHVYAVAHLKDGGKQFVVMTKTEVDAIRARSKSKDSGPWVTDYEQMALKTAIKRLIKYLPMSVELADALDHDARAEDDDVATITANVEQATTIDLQPKRTRTAQARKMLDDRKAKVQSTAQPEQPQETPFDGEPAKTVTTGDDRAQKITTMCAAGGLPKTAAEDVRKFAESVIDLLSDPEFNEALDAAGLTRADTTDDKWPSIGVIKLREFLACVQTVVAK